MFRKLPTSRNLLVNIFHRNLLETLRSELPMFNNNNIINIKPNIKMWAHYWFPRDKPLTLPIFNFATGTYTGENAVLKQEIFNVPIRKDIVLRVLLYDQNYNKKTTTWGKSKADVSGSNKKPFQQKKTGRAPQGDKRAPNLYKGGKAHPVRPREFYFPLNKRVILAGMKSVLSSKLLENNVMLVDTENHENALEPMIMKRFSSLNKNKILFVTGENFSKKFEKQQWNISYLTHITPKELNVDKLTKNKFVVFTSEGLKETQEMILLKETRCNLRKVNEWKYPLEHVTDKYKFNFNPELEIDIKTNALKGFFQKKDEYTQKWTEKSQREELELQQDIKEKQEKIAKKKIEYEKRREKRLKVAKGRKATK